MVTKEEKVLGGAEGTAGKKDSLGPKERRVNG